MSCQHQTQKQMVLNHLRTRGLGYALTWIEPEDELQRIERENNELLKALTKRMERADSLRSQLRAVEGGRR